MAFNIFLSSNSREGYSQDVIDLFAKPRGALQVFRYASKWISDEVTARSDWENLGKGEKALLCYVDQATKGVTPKIVPVRFATISEIRRHGTTVSINFELEDWCKFEGLEKFNSDIRDLSSKLPDYTAGKLDGKYWLRVPSSGKEICKGTIDLGDWERLVEFYYETPNAVDDAPFYRFEGLFELKRGKAVEATTSTSGVSTYVVDGGEEYEVRVYHYHPRQHFPELLLEVSSDGDALESLNGVGRILSTRYDRKDYRFRSKFSVLGEETRLSFQRKEAVSGNLIWEDFQIGVRVQASLGLALISVGVTAAGFATPFIVRSLTDPSKDWPVIVGAVVGGAVIGAITIAKDDYNRAIALVSNAWQKAKIFRR